MKIDITYYPNESYSYLWIKTDNPEESEFVENYGSEFGIVYINEGIGKQYSYAILARTDLNELNNISRWLMSLGESESQDENHNHFSTL